jgi:hypothetical protein
VAVFQQQMSLQDDFLDRVSLLRNVHFDEAAGRLVALLAWLDEEAATHEILHRLRTNVDLSGILGRANMQRPPQANSPEEVAAVGLGLIEASRHHPFFMVCRARGIRAPYGSTNFQDTTDAGLLRYIQPFLVYVGNELEREALSHSPSRIAATRIDRLLLGPEFAKIFPGTHAALEKISAEFLRPQDEVSWQNVGNSCRQAMIDFCKEAQSVLGFEPPDDLKQSDVKAIARALVRSLHGKNRFSDSLETVIAATWDHIQSMLHRGSATREDALRIYLWTGMVLEEIADLVHASDGASRVADE